MYLISSRELLGFEAEGALDSQNRYIVYLREIPEDQREDKVADSSPPKVRLRGSNQSPRDSKVTRTMATQLTAKQTSANGNTVDVIQKAITGIKDSMVRETGLGKQDADKPETPVEGLSSVPGEISEKPIPKRMAPKSRTSDHSGKQANSEESLLVSSDGPSDDDEKNVLPAPKRRRILSWLEGFPKAKKRRIC